VKSKGYFTGACPVEFPDLSGTPLGIQQGAHISLGPSTIPLGRSAPFALCAMRSALFCLKSRRLRDAPQAQRSFLPTPLARALFLDISEI